MGGSPSEDSMSAFGGLKECLAYTRASGYRLYEADIRVGLAWAYLAAGDKNAARKEASYAKQMSEGMTYYWGLYAEDVLAKALFSCLKKDLS
jgi:hypothetical protein